MKYPTIWCIELKNQKQNGCLMAENLIYHNIVWQTTWHVL